MDLSITSGAPEKQRTACVVIAVYQTRKLSDAAKQLDTASAGALTALLRRGDMDGELGQTQWLYEPAGCLCERVLLVGCGKEREFGDRAYRRATEAAIRALDKSGATDAVSYLSELNIKGRELPWRIRQAVVISEDVLYRFDQLKSEKHEPMIRTGERL